MIKGSYMDYHFSSLQSIEISMVHMFSFAYLWKPKTNFDVREIKFISTHLSRKERHFDNDSKPWRKCQYFKERGKLLACMFDREKKPFDSSCWRDWTCKCSEHILDVLGGEIHVHIKKVCSSNIMVRGIKGWLHKECIY